MVRVYGRAPHFPSLLRRVYGLRIRALGVRSPPRVSGFRVAGSGFQGSSCRVYGRLCHLARLVFGLKVQRSGGRAWGVGAEG